MLDPTRDNARSTASSAVQPVNAPVDSALSAAARGAGPGCAVTGASATASAEAGVRSPAARAAQGRHQGTRRAGTSPATADSSGFPAEAAAAPVQAVTPSTSTSTLEAPGAPVAPSELTPDAAARAGNDARRRGWFWHWNSIVTQYAPLIGLKGIGLLNSYTVWTDRRDESPHRGYAFPSQQAEGDFYGEERSELITINKLLVTLDLLEIRKEMFTRVDAAGRRWRVPHNLYRVKDRDGGWILRADDVLRVACIASADANVFRYVRRVFSPRFKPIDRDSPWHAILDAVQHDPTWQALRQRAADMELRASARSRAGHVARAQRGAEPLPASADSESLASGDVARDADGATGAAELTTGHIIEDVFVESEQDSVEQAVKPTAVAASNTGLAGPVPSVAMSNTGYAGQVAGAVVRTNSGVRAPDATNAPASNVAAVAVVAPSNTTEYQQLPTTTTTTTTPAAKRAAADTHDAHELCGQCAPTSVRRAEGGAATSAGARTRSAAAERSARASAQPHNMASGAGQEWDTDGRLTLATGLAEGFEDAVDERGQHADATRRAPIGARRRRTDSAGRGGLPASIVGAGFGEHPLGELACDAGALDAAPSAPAREPVGGAASAGGQPAGGTSVSRADGAAVFHTLVECAPGGSAGATTTTTTTTTTATASATRGGQRASELVAAGGQLVGERARNGTAPTRGRRAVAGAGGHDAGRSLAHAPGGGPLGDPSDLVISLFEAANDRRSTPLERILLAELEHAADSAARAAGADGAAWVAAALRDAVAAGSRFVAPRRIHEIISRWAADVPTTSTATLATATADDERHAAPGGAAATAAHAEAVAPRAGAGAAATRRGASRTVGTLNDPATATVDAVALANGHSASAVGACAAPETLAVHDEVTRPALTAAAQHEPALSATPPVVRLPGGASGAVVWRRTLAELAQGLDVATFARLLAGSVIVGYREGTVEVLVASAAAADTLSTGYRALIERRLNAQVRQPVAVRFSAPPDAAAATATAAAAAAAIEAHTPQRPTASATGGATSVPNADARGPLSVAAADLDLGRQLWQVALAALAADLPADEAQRLANVVVLGQAADERLLLAAPTPHSARLLERRRQPIERALAELLGHRVCIHALSADEWRTGP